jgi:hypothetical protein
MRDHQTPAIRAPTHVTTATQGDSTPRQRESWLGDRRIAGELTGMGRQVDASTVWAILKRTGIVWGAKSPSDVLAWTFMSDVDQP